MVQYPWTKHHLEVRVPPWRWCLAMPLPFQATQNQTLTSKPKQWEWLCLGTFIWVCQKCWVRQIKLNPNFDLIEAEQQVLAIYPISAWPRLFSSIPCSCMWQLMKGGRYPRRLVYHIKGTCKAHIELQPQQEHADICIWYAALRKLIIWCPSTHLIRIGTYSDWLEFWNSIGNVCICLLCGASLLYPVVLSLGPSHPCAGVPGNKLFMVKQSLSCSAVTTFHGTWLFLGWLHAIEQYLSDVNKLKNLCSRRPLCHALIPLERDLVSRNEITNDASVAGLFPSVLWWHFLHAGVKVACTPLPLWRHIKAFLCGCFAQACVQHSHVFTLQTAKCTDTTDDVIEVVRLELAMPKSPRRVY